MRPQIAQQWHQPESANRAIYAFNNDKNEPDGDASEQYHVMTLVRVADEIAPRFPLPSGRLRQWRAFHQAASALPNRWLSLQTRLYADEQYPYPVVKCLREFGHDVLTVQEAGKANQRIPDDEVLAFATARLLSVVTWWKFHLPLPKFFD
jgi:hypothetical protein